MENSQETGRGVRESLQASSIDSNHHLPKNYFTDKKYYQIAVLKINVLQNNFIKCFIYYVYCV